MNRREFLQAFAATTATVSASSILAGIPEAEPVIQLLEPQPIITSLNTIDVSQVLDYQVSIHVDYAHNNRAVVPSTPTHRQVEARFTILDTDVRHLDTITFSSISNLSGTWYIEQIEVSAQVHQHITVNITAHQIL